MKKFIILLALLLPTTAWAQNGPSGSQRVQGVPAGYGDPVQVTVVSANGGTATGPVTPVTDNSGSLTVDCAGAACATAAKQDTQITSLVTINTTLGTPFQTGGAIAALPAGTAIIGKVGIDQTTPGTTNLVSAGQSGAWNITNVSGTVSLPTGAATATGVAAVNTTLGTPMQQTGGTVAATESGTWTVQPGNTANTTAWKVDGSAVTQPVSGTVTAAQVNASSTDFSGTVTLGNTYQTALTSSATRKGCLIQNPPTASEVLNVKVGTMASPFVLKAGASFNCAAGNLVVTDTITITAATTSHAFVGVSQ